MVKPVSYDTRKARRVDVIVEGPPGTEWHLVRVLKHVSLRGQPLDMDVWRRVDEGELAVLPADVDGAPLDPGADLTVAWGVLVVEPVEWTPSADDGRRRLEHLRQAHPEHSWWLVASVPIEAYS